MHLHREFNPLRPYLLSGLFFFYYTGISLLALIMWFASQGVAINALTQTPFTMVLILTGFTSGALLFATAIPTIDFALKSGYRKRAGNQLVKTLGYFFAQLFLFLLPFVVVVDGAWLFTVISPALVFAGISMVLASLTFCRFRGLTGILPCEQ